MAIKYFYLFLIELQKIAKIFPYVYVKVLKDLQQEILTRKWSSPAIYWRWKYY